jgi:hypothetical protein
MKKRETARRDTMTLDHPRVRASCTCPLCDGPKDAGLVTCWSCYRGHNLRNGMDTADQLMIDMAEKNPTRHRAIGV